MSSRVSGWTHYDYYDDALEFSSNRSDVNSSREADLNFFIKGGLSEVEASAYCDSGYTTLRDEIVIDRFYGGLLWSTDNRTRFSRSQFPIALKSASSRFSVHYTQSLKELNELVGNIKSKAQKRLLFRGQTKNYALKRPRPNMNFSADGIGEISLLPSVWRRVLRDRYDIFHDFQGLDVSQWSKIVILRVLRKPNLMA